MDFNSEDLFLSTAKRVMKIMGVWVPPENTKIYRRLFGFLMILLQHLFLLFEVVYLFQVWGDLEAVAQASSLLFTQACLCFKITVFQFSSKILREILGQMNSEVFKPQNVTHEKLLKSQATRIRRLMLAFMAGSQLTCAVWAMNPLFNNEDIDVLPFEMWMPIRLEKRFNYWLAYIFQSTTISMSAFMYFGVDSVTLSTVLFGCAQIDIIKEKLMDIAAPVKDPETGSYSESLSNNYTKLVECIKHHQAILIFTDLTQKAYHKYLFFQLSVSVGLVCMSVFRLSAVDWRSMQFLSIIVYLPSMIYVLYVCCWCGHELTTTSEDLHKAIYQCNWPEQSVKFKRELCFMLMRVRRPIVLRAANYITLSKQTFVLILRTSYSYFAVLNQRKDK